MDEIQQEVVETPSEPVESPVETPVEAPSEAPQDQVTPEAPVVETPQEERFKLPDGREVTPKELYDLHVNELLPDYTRKSQKLSEYENINKPKVEDIPEWKREDYVPKSYAELVELAERNAVERIKQEKLEEENRFKEVSSLVDTQIAEIKKVDPSIDENSLFLHANKYGFRDLKAAHSNMKAMKDAALEAEQRTLKNLKARGLDPVGTSGAPVVSGDAVDYNDIASGKYGSALDYLQRIKGK